MLFKRKLQNEEICILKFDRVILDFNGVVLSDRNASSSYVAFYEAKYGLENIDFKLVYARYWTDDNYFEQCRRKSIKCAEVLVPYGISYDYVVFAAVVNDAAADRLRLNGFDKNIFIEPKIFF